MLADSHPCDNIGPPPELTRFIAALFLPNERIVLRPIETWTNGGKKRSHVFYKHIAYLKAGRLGTDPKFWAVTLQQAADTRANVFFGVCPRFGATRSKTWDRAWQIRIVRVLWADLDHCTPEEALERCDKAGLLRPSIVIRSGHGVHLYWLLAESFVIDDVGDPPPVLQEWVEVDGKKRPRNYVESGGERVYEFLTDPQTRGNSKRKNSEFPDRLSPKALRAQHVIQGIAQQIGGDHTQDLSRLLRLPGTFNRKDERNGTEPVPCELVECDENRRYAFADFEAFAAFSPDKQRADELAKIRLPKRRLTQGRQGRLIDLINRCNVADDRSRADWRLCCWAISQGLDKEEVWQQVCEAGKFAERGRSYFDLTWDKAQDKVRATIHTRLRREAGAKATRGEPPSGNGNGKPHDDGGAGQGGKPWIQANKRQLPDVTADTLRALIAANDPPTLFQRGNVLTRLRAKSDTGAPYLETLDDSAVRGLMARSARWKKLVTGKHGDDEEECPPPIDAVKDLMALPGWDGIPVIDSVVECPVFGPGGELVIEPGYHPNARLWYSPAKGLDVPPVSEAPAREEIDRAKALLLVELYGDFPFKDDSSKAHALAALLLPFVRRMIDGPTPLHHFDAPVEGTGKTLLVSTITVTASGREPEGFTESTNDEEWRKRITAALEEGGAFMFMDNLNRVLDSGALASVLTARTWKDRKLGYTKMLTIQNVALWMASGNNTRFSRELIRRTVFCRLDAKVDAPWERKDFRHPNLLKWAKENRGQLVWAALTLVQAWIAAVRPAGTETFGMFEAWVAVIGGILGVAGVPGLLTNAREFRQIAADKTAEWVEFVSVWWHRYAGGKVGIADLFGLATGQQLLDSVLGDEGERSQRIRLGKAMAKVVDRVFGKYRIERAGHDHSDRQQYQLVEVEAKAQPAKPATVVDPGADETGKWAG
jgi:hypothetical protein